MPAKIYQAAPPEVLALLKRAMQDYHSNLYALQIPIACTMVAKLGQEDELIPCLKLHGANCAALIKLVPASERVYVSHAAEILIDQCTWESLTEAQRVALLDHELSHLTLARKKNGEQAVDEAGRPKLRTRPDDWNATGFLEIVRRHGLNSLEANEAVRIHDAVNEAVRTHATVDQTQTISQLPDFVPVPERISS